MIESLKKRIPINNKKWEKKSVVFRAKNHLFSHNKNVLREIKYSFHFSLSLSLWSLEWIIWIDTDAVVI